MLKDRLNALLLHRPLAFVQARGASDWKPAKSARYRGKEKNAFLCKMRNTPGYEAGQTHAFFYVITSKVQQSHVEIRENNKGCSGVKSSFFTDESMA